MVAGGQGKNPLSGSFADLVIQDAEEADEALSELEFNLSRRDDSEVFQT